MTRFAVLICLHLIVLAWFLTPVKGYADSLRLLGDWTYSNTSSDTKDIGGPQRSNTESQRFSQIYRLDLSKELGPIFFLNGGVQLEDNDLRSETESTEMSLTKTRSEGSTVRPYVDLQWLMPLFTLSGGYEERESKTKTTRTISDGGSSDTNRNFMETTTARFFWSPVDFPSLELDYSRTLSYDKPLTRDNESEVYRLSSKYRWEGFEFLYGYLHSDEEQNNYFQERDDDRKIISTESLAQTHNGRVRYAGRFFDNRLAVNAGARMERSTVEFRGAEKPSIPTFPRGIAFYREDDQTPFETDPLPDNSSIYYDTFTPSSPLDLNNAETIFPVSFGRDFGEPALVDAIKVLLNINTDTYGVLLNTDVRFRAFISRDQENWEEVPNVSTSLVDDESGKHYLIDLPSSQNTKYIKVWLSALNIPPGSPSSELFVTDVQAFFTPPADVNEITSTYQNLNAGLSWKVTDKTQILYDATYQYRETDLFDDARARLSNGLSLIHRFNPIFSGTARLLRSDAWEQWKHDTATTNYSAQLVGRYLPTLKQSLTYSGVRNEEPEGKSVSNAIILRTNAEMYTGWDISFDQGYNWQDSITGQDTSAFFVRLQNSLIPHPRFNLIADYSIRWEQQKHEPTERGETGRVRATWSPTNTLSLNGEVRQRRNEEDIYTYWEYGASWLPLRDGTLQFNMSYYEDGDTDDNWRRTFSPSLAWSVTEAATLRVLYNIGHQEVREEITDYQSFMVNLRIYTN